MGQYGGFLTELLRPLGIYDLTAGNANESELYALGNVLDGVAAELETAERESHIATAEGIGLDLREALFASRPAAPHHGAETGSGHRADADRWRQSDSGGHQPHFGGLRDPCTGRRDGHRASAGAFSRGGRCAGKL